ncbi:SDR family NAD(P)-dependent oxidoreductase [Sneathiella chinensis]|uniref:Short-chain dehydrogenase n=1 Tax=Sneathiella chinensis TaxID=349750 RepID=A0ABQ5U744_9PROT|nr:SDR family oxidoreductase [Sneathiella chinensis]GLQ07137.1 short-chain dehydrogenase [Sneathiella chinensis]
MVTRSDLESDPWTSIGRMVEQARQEKPPEANGPLSGQHILIAGGNRGLGFHIAETLAAQGAALSLMARDLGTLHEKREQLLARFGGQVHDGLLDVRNPAEIETALEWACNLYGPPTALINATGLPCTAPFDATGIDDWNTILDTNLTGARNLIEAALPHFREKGHGCVINFAPASVLDGAPGQAAYAAAKAGLLSLGKSLDKELADDNIRFFTLCPGIILTAETEKALDDIAAAQSMPVADVIAHVATANGQARLLAPQEISRVVLDILLGHQQERVIYLPGDTADG